MACLLNPLPMALKKIMELISYAFRSEFLLSVTAVKLDRCRFLNVPVFVIDKTFNS